MKSLNLRLTVGIAAFAIGQALGVSTAMAGKTCKDSAGFSPCSGASSPCVCVERFDLNDPEEGTDFSFDFSDSVNVDVTFKTGHSTNAWRVWSQVSVSDTTPANLGDLFIDSTGSSDDYTVEIKNPNICPGGICNPGAANLKSAVLDDTTGWTGLSSITSGHITGDVGAITVAADGTGAGGVLNLRVEGNATGAIVAETVTGTLDIDGTQSGTITINDDVTGDLIINKMEGDVTYKADLVGGDITIESWIKGGTLWVQGDVPNTTTMISIADLQSSATEHAEVYLGSYSQPDQFWGDLELLNGIPAGQDVFFYASLGGTSVVIDLNGRNLGGILFIFDGGYGQIINGGTIKNGGLMQLHSVGGGAPPTFSGSATFGGVEAGGILRSVAVSLDEATVTINGAMAGAIDVLNGHLYGDVNIASDLTGTITIDDSLKATGRILVTGLLDGSVSIGTETEALSQIRADQGLGSNGCIVINADQGAFDANGIIHLGPATILDPLNNVTFDGGIKIFDRWPFGGAGDLEGAITVTGCHATSVDLDICVDGNINGTITLNQTGCTNQVAHSCVGACP